MSSFNLVDEPWIPSVTLGGRREELGLQDTLVRAHDILEIHDPSPLVTASLHRLLLAVLHRVFGPEVVADWQKLWQEGHFEPLAIEGYFKKWHSRFYLFDEKNAFYQVCQFTSKSKRVKVNDLVHEYARGNNPTLFDHTTDDTCLPLLPSEAARKLIAYHFFSLGGLSGLGRDVAFPDAPLAKHIFFLVRGSNLFETLMLNLVKYDKSEPVPIMHQDSPIWEQVASLRSSDIPQGYLDYLTWQTRLLRLVSGASGGSVFVGEVDMAQGYRLLKDIPFFDPALFYRKEKAWQPLRFLEYKALWRESSALFGAIQRLRDNHFGLLHWLWQLVDSNVIPQSRVYYLEAFGLCAKQAKVNFWRHERMPMPLDYLANQDLVNDLTVALEHAESVAAVLSKAVWTLAGDLVRENDKVSRNQIAGHLKPSQVFWSRLERPFYETMESIPKEPERALSQWDKTLRQAAWHAFEASTCSLDHSARTLKALEDARRSLAGGLAKVLPKEVNNG